MNNCKNCNDEISGNFCSYCGHPTKLKRIDGHYILHEIQHVLHFDNGIFFTIKELLIRPGQIVREFITDNRNRLIKPLVFIVITSLIYTIIVHFFQIKGEYINFKDSPGEDSSDSFIRIVFEWIQNHYGYANLIIGIYITFWLKIFFKKYYYNFFEILILFCFVMGIGMLLFSLFAIIEGVIHVHIMQLAAFFFISYNIWATSQFFDGNKIISYIKSLFAYILGILSFTISAFFLGVALDFLFKQ